MRVALLMLVLAALLLIVCVTNALTGMDDQGWTTGGLRGGPAVRPSAIGVQEATVTYFIAVNFFNSSDVLSGFVPELKRLLETLGPQHCYVSVWENGSSDGTQGMLRSLKLDLDAMGVGNRIIISDVSIVDLCVEAGLKKCSEKTFKNGVRHTKASTRIQMMALLRNKPLAPLYRHLGENKARLIQKLYPQLQDEPKKIDRAKTMVIYFNDIWFSHTDVVQLVNTRKMDYDLACAVDFHPFAKLYDLWVLRDINGLVLNPWYPYFWDDKSAWDVYYGRPVRVYSCWNGLVVFDATVLGTSNQTGAGIRFRKWRPLEKRAPTPVKKHLSKAEKEVFDKSVFDDDNCSVSECQLFSKDLWDAGRTRIYVNPAVKIDYNRYHRLLRMALLPIVDAATFLVWYFKSPYKFDFIMNPSTNGTVTHPPIDVKCGIDYATQNGRT